MIGRGAKSQVKLVRQKSNRAVFVMKIIPKKFIFEHNLLVQIKREVRLQKEMRHPHVIQLKTYFEEKDNVILVLELAAKGSFSKYMARKRRLSKREAFLFFFQTCLGIDNLHKHKMRHDDLNLESLLLDEKKQHKNL